MVLASCNLTKISYGLAFLLLLFPAFSFAASTARIAIVIDDIGYRKSDAAAIKLDGNFTYSIVPFAPLTRKFAHAAHANNKEVMAHIPMEASRNNHLLGKGAITTNMSKDQLVRQLKLAISNVPFAQGINNHMGSKFTTQPQPVHWVMEQLAQSNLYFLDSKTSANSVGESVALKFGLQTGHRHIFLDNELDQLSLERQFDRLIRIAQKHHNAIAIAHPHPETIAFLSTIQSKLNQLGIELVPLSEILPYTTKVARAKRLAPAAQSQNPYQSAALAK
ncbi:MAG: divergent polysaccharide deacetylase family protein [Gammaproteobacteria bacterium]|nr:divergent polysaccharide deacetylase family protein [Gammaproteobacteria bacterium]